jgi:putative FmdB family regulatory protein
VPTYEYVCEACDNRFDEFQSMKDEPLKKCPACKKNRLRRLFGTGAAVLFKGSGFYETDYRSEAYKSAAKADQEAAKPADAGKDGASATNGTGAASTGGEGKAAAAKTPKSKS